MKHKDLVADSLSDVKDCNETPLLPGQFVPLDIALFCPAGRLP